jgi:hypothetical protein
MWSLVTCVIRVGPKQMISSRKKKNAQG